MTSLPPPRPVLFIVGLPRMLRHELADAFRVEGYAVSLYDDMRLAAAAVERDAPDALLIDWQEESLAFIRRFGGLVPVLLLSARGALLHVVQGLRAGAADVMRLPCHFPEVLARVERARATTTTQRQVSSGLVSLDVASGLARINGESVIMTEREARMLAALLRCPGHPVPRETLMRIAGITTAKPTIVESYIKQLRKRHAVLRRALRTRYGRGYAFCQ